MWELEDTILLVPHLQGCISQESVWKPSQTGNWKEENLAAVQVPLLCLQGVPYLPGEPQDEAGLLRKFEM